MKQIINTILTISLLYFSTCLYAELTWDEWITIGFNSEAIYGSCVTEDGRQIDWPENFNWEDWNVRFEDPIAQDFEINGANTIAGLEPDILAGRNCIKDLIENHLNGKVLFNSGYRPPEYQSHFYDIHTKYKWLKYDKTPECAPLKAYYKYEHGADGHALNPRVAETNSKHSKGNAIDISRNPENTRWSATMTCQTNPGGGECCHNSIFQWCSAADEYAYSWELCRSELVVNEEPSGFPMKCNDEKIVGGWAEKTNCIKEIAFNDCYSVPSTIYEEYFRCDILFKEVDVCSDSDSMHPKITLDMIAEVCGLYNPYPEDDDVHFIKRD